MKVTTITPTPFDIPEKDLELYSIENIEEILYNFCQLGKQKFYMLDYYRKKIIVDSPISPILCGHPKKIAYKEGFRFFDRVLSDAEWIWMNKMNKQALEVFFKMPEQFRKELIISYDLEFETINKSTKIVHHKVKPYKLCNNGNLWLGLCFITTSNQKKSGKTTLVNTHTGEQYEILPDNRVEKIKTQSLTNNEITILRMLVKGYTTPQICEHFDISESAYKGRLFEMRKKAGVATTNELIYWANLEGVF